MGKECAVCKKPAVLTANIQKGEESTVAFLCENCVYRLGGKFRVEIVSSSLSSLPKGFVIGPNALKKEEQPRESEERNQSQDKFDKKERSEQEDLNISASSLKCIRDELRSYRFEFDLMQKIPCSKQKNKEYEALLKNGGVLPEGVHPYVNDSGEESTREFYTVYTTDLTDAEIA